MGQEINRFGARNMAFGTNADLAAAAAFSQSTNKEVRKLGKDFEVAVAGLAARFQLSDTHARALAEFTIRRLDDQEYVGGKAVKIVSENPSLLGSVGDIMQMHNQALKGIYEGLV